MATPHFEFDWDPVKAAINLAKHKVSFPDAMLVFLDPLALSRPDDDHDGADERWITIGLDRDRKLVVVVHTHDAIESDLIAVRIISARKPSKRERRDYEQSPA